MSFVASTTFTGAKEGFVFKIGRFGLGYYFDEPLANVATESMEKDVEPPREWAIGMRAVDDDGFFATVRYIGPIRSAKNPKTTYVGVEWDDPSRGKHNGTVPAKDLAALPETYFVTKSHPQAGSFVLPKKLNRGVTFSEAMSTVDNESTVTHAILKSMMVDRAGAPPPEGCVFADEAALVFLNLEDNLLSSFADAFDIAGRCPRLAMLRLGKNKFELPLPQNGSPLPPPTTLPFLDSLTLTMCGLQSCWPLLLGTLLSPRVLPLLRELSLAGNPDLFLPPQLQAPPSPSYAAAADAAVAAAPELLANLSLKKDRDDGEVEEEVTLALVNATVVGISAGQDRGGGGGDLLRLRLPRLQVLELSNTGLQHWAQVEAIGVQCQALNTLGLAHNGIRTLGTLAASSTTDHTGEGSPLPPPPPPTATTNKTTTTTNTTTASTTAVAAAAGTSLAEEPPPLASLTELNLDSNLVASSGDVLALAVRLPDLTRFGFVGNPLVKHLDRRRADRLLLPMLPSCVSSLDGRAVGSQHRKAMNEEFLVAALRTSVPRAVAILQGSLKLRVLVKESQKEEGAEEEEEGAAAAAAATAAAIPRLEDFVEMGPPSTPTDGASGTKGGCLALQAMQAALAENGYFHFGGVVAAFGAPLLYQRLLDR